VGEVSAFAVGTLDKLSAIAYGAAMTETDTQLALELIQTRRTLVLATADPEPWVAPVYYVYRAGRFYFFSSPASRHVRAALAAGRCAGSVFRDSDDWRQIEGLQMDGHLVTISVGATALAVFGDYLNRFPTVTDLFGGAGFDFRQFTERFRTRMYAFVPERIFYLNNQAGLGKRQQIRLPG
jgi:uncharacterized protein YhbP (UPF0306 family)